MVDAGMMPLLDTVRQAFVLRPDNQTFVGGPGLRSCLVIFTMKTWNLLLISVLACTCKTSQAASDELKFPATAPTQARDTNRSFHLLEGFDMQLIAAEPLVTDPVAITYDEDGRAYVCEMNDYPYTDKARHRHSQENPTDQAIGKVRLLTDTDGDGTFDKATVFADGLSWPTGAACWKGGIFVTATPDVWYLKDTNNDGVADIRQKVLTGFKKLNVQAVMNNPIWGLDHRIYVAGGSNGGEIQRVPGSESVMPLPKDSISIPFKRNDFSFDPSTGDVRLESGGARFGNTFDDWGNRFLCNIRNPCQHVVLPYHYLARNPYLVVPGALNDCAEAGDQLPVYRTSPPEPWREFRAKRWAQEGSTLPKSELVGAGVVTSSAGITVYRGDAYPPEYRDFAFVADVAGNLFYRMKLVPDGVTFKAVQVDGTKNFCTSDDVWFRPVNFVNAPDGCLHVCDMYREVIEHPWSIPDDIHAALDLLKGRDKGRIYRLAPKATTVRAAPKLSQASTTELVALLDHPNAWHRETAQRLLFERQDPAAIQPLHALAREARTAQGRIAALNSLQGIVIPKSGPPMMDYEDASMNIPLINGAASTSRPGALTAGDLKTASDDKDDHVVAHAIRLMELSLPRTKRVKTLTPPPDLDDITKTSQLGVALEVINAARAGVYADFQKSLSIGAAWYLASDHALAEVASKHASDPWFRAAILSSSHVSVSTPMEMRLLAVAARVGGPKFQPPWTEGHDELFIELCRTVALNPAPSARCVALQCALNCEDNPALGDAALLAVTESLRKTGDTPEAVLTALVGKKDVDGERIEEDVINELKARLLVIQKHLPLLIASTQEPAGRRIVALKLCSTLPLSAARTYVLPMLAPSQPAEFQSAALETLSTYKDPEVADLLISSWQSLTPALRDKAVTLMLSRTDRIARLLDAIEAKTILSVQLSVAARAALSRQKSPALSERITNLLGTASNPNRQAVIEKYQASLSLTGDPANGAKIYAAACMVCHRHLDKGNDIGPNLGTVKGWTPEQILTNVLDPNREVSPNFALYMVETTDGRTLGGLIASETAGNLTLKRADGGTDQVLRSEIKSLASPGISLMPEGLEAALSPQQMADLIAFLKQL